MLTRMMPRVIGGDGVVSMDDHNEGRYVSFTQAIKKIAEKEQTIYSLNNEIEHQKYTIGILDECAKANAATAERLAGILSDTKKNLDGKDEEIGSLKVKLEHALEAKGQAVSERNAAEVYVDKLTEEIKELKSQIDSWRMTHDMDISAVKQHKTALIAADLEKQKLHNENAELKSVLQFYCLTMNALADRIKGMGETITKQQAEVTNYKNRADDLQATADHYEAGVKIHKESLKQSEVACCKLMEKLVVTELDRDWYMRDRNNLIKYLILYGWNIEKIKNITRR